MLVTEKLQTTVGTIEVPVHQPVVYGALKIGGEYCPGEANTYRSLIGPGATVIDIGANIGFFTLVFAAAVGETGRVISLEPQRTIHDILCRNVNTAGARCVEPRRAIASDRLGRQPFVDIHTLAADQTAWLGSASVDHVIEAPHCTMVETEVITIDSLDLPRCEFIKIDVEGHEPAVIAGAAVTIARHRPLLSIEVDRADRDYGFVDALARDGYGFRLMIAFYLRHRAGNAPVPGGTAIRGYEIADKVSRMLIAAHQDRLTPEVESHLARFRPIASTADLVEYLANNTV